MRVVHTGPAPARRVQRVSDEAQRNARIERAGLVATTFVLVFGLWLSYVGQMADTDGVRTTPAGAPANPAPPLVDLSAVGDARELLPALASIPEDAGRNAVAAALFGRLSVPPRIEHVGALASVTLSSDRIRQDARLRTLNERLRARPNATAVAALSGSDLAAFKRTVMVRTPAQFRNRLALSIGLFMLAFWAAHVVRWRLGTTGDGILLPVVHLLCGLGLMTLLAIRDPLRDMMLIGQAATGMAVGCVLFVAVSRIDFEDPRLGRSSLLPLGGAAVLALLLLVLGTGPTGSGAKVNLFGTQPVEAIRLLVTFGLAAYFARRWNLLRTYSTGIGEGTTALQLPRWKDVRPLALTIGVLLAFFFLQRDLGPALVLSCVFLGLYGMSRGRAPLVVGGFGLLIAGFAAGYLLGVPATVMRRVTIWMNPWQNAVAGGDQIAHALWAMASGGAWGVGPGVGNPELIPAGHTDLVIAALGEELGYVGVACVAALFVLLLWRTLRIGWQAPGDYTCFLAIGLTLGLAAQALVIVGGTLGVLPLAGVVTPFLSYGRSAMLSNFAAVAVCAAIARRRGPARPAFNVPIRSLSRVLAVATAVVVLRAGAVQVLAADRVIVRPDLTLQADGGYRYQYNPRLVAVSRRLVRGSILDRSGLPLATSHPEELTPFADRLATLGLKPACPLDTSQRCYPLGGLGFHLLGDADRQTNWAARNVSFVEQDFDGVLKGFDDRPHPVQVPHPITGRTLSVVSRDFTELVPLVRHKGNPSHAAVRRVLGSDRTLRLTIDAGLQVKVARALRDRVVASGARHGAAVVLDPTSGALLATASYPWPEQTDLASGSSATERLLDRARYGLYPPGSTFKLVTAVAALRSTGSEDRSTFECQRLGDGRVGGRVAETGAIIRDDLEDHTPHGRLDLDRALVVSCNAYFASLAQRLGSKALAEAAAAAQIAVAPSPAEPNLRRSLAHAGYGQGEVVATPLRMARVTAALADRGILHDVRVVPPAAGKPASGTRWVSDAGAARLRRDMRAAVVSGTGRAVAGHPVAIAGKTGTAEVEGKRSHAWFVGFAPYATPRVAFAVIVENAGYGGRVAAPLAGDIVTAARDQGLFK